MTGYSPYIIHEDFQKIKREQHPDAIASFIINIFQLLSISGFERRISYMQRRIRIWRQILTSKDGRGAERVNPYVYII